MTNRKNILFFIITMLVPVGLYAQSNSVRASLQVNPPYSVYLNDYVAPGSNRLRLNLSFNDREIDEVRVRLRFKLNGTNATIRTKENYKPVAPIILSSGTPELLSSDDLIEYFNPNNLEFQGEGFENFRRTTRIPEDYYQFCVQVVEYDRNTVISEYSCGVPAFIAQNNPPVMTQISSGSAFAYNPVSTAEGSKLEATYPQIVNLQWSPNNASSPNSAFNTTYELQIVEVYPDDRDPNEAFRTQFIYIIDNLTQKNYILRADDYALQAGRSYAVRVKVTDDTGLELFKNQGYSPAYKFKYGERCLPPFNLSATTANFNQLKFTWTQSPGNTEYVVKYRESGQSDWYTAPDVQLNAYQVNNLRDGKQYEYKLSATCGTIISDESTVQSIAIPQREKEAFVCGTAGTIQPLAQGEPLALLKPGDEINAGKYTVHITEVSGSNGLFTGKGYVVMPFLGNAKLRVEYTNIFVNNQHTASKGILRVTGGGVQAVPDDIKEAITVITTDFHQALDDVNDQLSDIEKYVKEADNQVKEAQKTLDEVKDLPEDARKAITDGKNLIAQGKAMITSGNTPQGENLIESGKDKLQEGIKKAIENIKSGGLQGADQLKELFEAALTARKDTARKDSVNVSIKLEKSRSEYAEMCLEFNVTSDDDTTQLNESPDISEYAFEDTPPNNKWKELVGELPEKAFEQDKLGLDYEKIKTVLVFVYKTLKNNPDFDSLFNQFKTEGANLLKNYVTNQLTGKQQETLEIQIKSFINKKIENLTR